MPQRYHIYPHELLKLNTLVKEDTVVDDYCVLKVFEFQKIIKWQELSPTMKLCLHHFDILIFKIGLDKFFFAVIVYDDNFFKRVQSSNALDTLIPIFICFQRVDMSRDNETEIAHRIKLLNY
jgi:hypothetical protein